MADEDLTLVILRNIQTRLAGLNERIDVTNQRFDVTNQLINQRFDTIEHTLEGYSKHVASVATFAMRASKRLTPAVKDLEQRVTILEGR